MHRAITTEIAQNENILRVKIILLTKIMQKRHIAAVLFRQFSRKVVKLLPKQSRNQQKRTFRFYKNIAKIQKQHNEL